MKETNIDLDLYYHKLKPMSHELAALSLRLHDVVKSHRALCEHREIWYVLSWRWRWRSHGDLGVSMELYGVPTAF